MTCLRLKNGQSAHEYCLKNGIQYKMVWFRVDEYGMDVEQAIKKTKEQSGKKPNAVYIGGKTIIELCNRDKSMYQRIQRRVHIKKMSFRDAFLLEGIETNGD